MIKFSVYITGVYGEGRGRGLGDGIQDWEIWNWGLLNSEGRWL